MKIEGVHKNEANLHKIKDVHHEVLFTNILTFYEVVPCFCLYILTCYAPSLYRVSSLRAISNSAH